MKIQPKPSAGSEPKSGLEAETPGRVGGNFQAGCDARRGGAAHAGSPAGGEDGGEQRSCRQEQRQRRGERGGVGRAGEERRTRGRATGPGPESVRGEGGACGWCRRPSGPTFARPPREGRVLGESGRAPGERAGGLVGEGHASLGVLGEPAGGQSPELRDVGGCTAVRGDRSSLSPLLRTLKQDRLG